MNLEELTRELTALLQSGRAEIPPTLQDIVYWGVVGNGIAAILLLGLCAVLAIVAGKLIRLSVAQDKAHEDGSTYGIIGTFLLVLGVPITAVMTIVAAVNALQAWVAPRAYLVDALKRLVS